MIYYFIRIITILVIYLILITQGQHYCSKYNQKGVIVAHGRATYSVDGKGNIYTATYTKISLWPSLASRGRIIATIVNYSIPQWYDICDDPLVYCSFDNIFVTKNSDLYILRNLIDGFTILKYNGNKNYGSYVAGRHYKIGIDCPNSRSPGCSLPYTYRASSIFIDNKQNIFVLITPASMVLKLRPGARTGIIVAGGHERGSNPNQLNYPYSIYVDNEENLFIADSENARVQKWTPGSKNGITVLGPMHTIRSGCQPSSRLSEILIDNDGSIVYLGKSIFCNRVIKWPANSQLGTGLITINESDVVGLRSDSFGNIYVLTWSNTGEGLILRYQCNKESFEK
ncbi:unnamed protein product [Rotaria sp. Silwood2]|nr:unnamed protein product [Rotaria sp. Silwood2]